MEIKVPTTFWRFKDFYFGVKLSKNFNNKFKFDLVSEFLERRIKKLQSAFALKRFFFFNFNE
jgi:hypothetical protein